MLGGRKGVMWWGKIGGDREKEWGVGIEVSFWTMCGESFDAARVCHLCQYNLRHFPLPDLLPPSSRPPFPAPPRLPRLAKEQSLKVDHFPSRGEDLTVRSSVIEGIYQLNAT